MKIRLEVSLEHPVMFVSDPYADEDASLDIDKSMIAATQGCIAVRVKPYFEGRADITVSSEEPPSSNDPDFVQSISCMSNILSLSDSGRFNYCMFPVQVREARVEIWRSVQDDDDVWIKLSPLIEY